MTSCWVHESKKRPTMREIRLKTDIICIVKWKRYIWLIYIIKFGNILIKINTFFNFCILSVFKFFLIFLRPCDGGELAYFHSGYLLLLLLVQHFNIVKIVCCLFFFILLLLCFKIIATEKCVFLSFFVEQFDWNCSELALLVRGTLLVRGVVHRIFL